MPIPVTISQFNHVKPRNERGEKMWANTVPIWEKFSEHPTSAQIARKVDAPAFIPPAIAARRWTPYKRDLDE